MSVPSGSSETPVPTNRPLKILICLLYYVPHRTGYTIHVQHVAEALAARGHEVTVLCARHSHDLARDEMVRGVRIVRLWAPIRMSRGMVMPAYPLALFEFMRRYDLIFTNTPMLETALVALVAQATGKSVVSTHHGDLVLPPGLTNRVITFIMFQFFKFMAKRAHRLIAYSHDYADHSYYLAPFLDKVSVIYPPISMPLPDPERSRTLRAQWSHEGGPVIGYSGRFVQEKRPDVLIKSLDTINAKYPNVRIVFAGQYNIRYEKTWENQQALVEKYKDQLIFLGELVDPQDMSNFYGALDIMCVPSDTECFMLAQVEAMLCGTPVVMTNIPGGRVPVTETGMGLLVPRGDPQAVGQAVLDILAEPEKYRKPRELILRTFDFDETISRYERHFQRAAAHSRVKLADWIGEATTSGDR